MNMKNHYKMGRRICAEMAANDMPLKKAGFMLGNLAPDLCLSFVIRPHLYALTAFNIQKLLARLCRGGNPRSAGFSFRLGVLTHYICDSFCYSHSPAFKGGTRAHVRYERRQRAEFQTMPLLTGPKGMAVGLKRMLRDLEAAIHSHNTQLEQDVQAAAADIPLAVDMATRAAFTAYLSSAAHRNFGENWLMESGGETAEQYIGVSAD